MGNAPHRFITFNFFVSTNGEEDALPDTQVRPRISTWLR